MARERVKDTVTFPNSECVRDTPKAILVARPDWERERWIPRGCVDDDSEVFEKGTTGDLVIARWFAEKEGIE